MLPKWPMGCGNTRGQGLGEPMTTDNEFDSTAINEIIQGLDPVDWTQLRLLADLTPAERVLAGMRAQSFAMAALRGTYRKRFPDLSLAELNMKVLAYLTPVRMTDP
jgi:hypothetical protein